MPLGNMLPAMLPYGLTKAILSGLQFPLRRQAHIHHLPERYRLELPERSPR